MQYAGNTIIEALFAPDAPPQLATLSLSSGEKVQGKVTAFDRNGWLVVGNRIINTAHVLEISGPWDALSQIRKAIG